MLSEIKELIQLATKDSFHQYILSLIEEENNSTLWKHCILQEEKGLELFMQTIATYDKTTLITLAHEIADFAYPIAIERAGEDALCCGLHIDAPSMDGASEGMKLKLVKQLLDNPTANNLQKVKDSIDPTRQLEVWEEDINPSGYDMWQWFTTVGQLCALAVVNDEDKDIDDEGNSLFWPGSICAIRCIIAALKSIRNDEGEYDIKSDIEKIGEVISNV